MSLYNYLDIVSYKVLVKMYNTKSDTRLQSNLNKELHSRSKIPVLTPKSYIPKSVTNTSGYNLCNIEILLICIVFKTLEDLSIKLYRKISILINYLYSF